MDGGAAANDMLMQFQADLLGYRCVARGDRDYSVGRSLPGGAGDNFWKSTARDRGKREGDVTSRRSAEAKEAYWSAMGEAIWKR